MADVSSLLIDQNDHLELKKEEIASRDVTGHKY
ncbi:unnamed protein product [uncultured virus]|nr:unnamed protein product [uncultured virus]